tara:strand:+ start:84 stop:341 length:258 start_codon:yes stop_codon:yes gene_type:complete
MTKENIVELNETNLTSIPEKFVITYWASKHKKFITRNGQWTKPDDMFTTGKAFVSKNGKVCFVYWDLDQNGWRMATELMTIKATV